MRARASVGTGVSMDVGGGVGTGVVVGVGMDAHGWIFPRRFAQALAERWVTMSFALGYVSSRKGKKSTAGESRTASTSLKRAKKVGRGSPYLERGAHQRMSNGQ